MFHSLGWSRAKRVWPGVTWFKDWSIEITLNENLTWDTSLRFIDLGLSRKRTKESPLLPSRVGLRLHEFIYKIIVQTILTRWTQTRPASTKRCTSACTSEMKIRFTPQQVHPFISKSFWAQKTSKEPCMHDIHTLKYIYIYTCTHRTSLKISLITNVV